MKNALPLVALLVILAGGIIWKTQFTDSAQGEVPPAPELGHVNFGLVTFGVDNNQADPTLADEVQVVAASSKATAKPSAASSQPVSKNNPEWPGPTNPALSDTVATAPETAATRPEQYWSVGSGQTLYRIAKSAYGVASLEIIEAIAAANQLDDPGAIRPGQKLLLPLIPGVTAPKGH